MPAHSSFSPLHDNPSMPAATVIPVLHYPDVLAGAAWLCEAFGFVERLRIGGHRIQLNVGDGAVVVAKGAGPGPAGGAATHSIMVRVTNVDQHFRHAQKSGAVIVTEPMSFPYGERQYSAVDPAGHGWTFSQSEFSIDPSAWGGQMQSASTGPT